MSCLADVKKNLKGIFDEAFDFVWEDVEKQLKTSYKNGYEAGQKDAKNGKAGHARAAHPRIEQPGRPRGRSIPREWHDRGRRAAARPRVPRHRAGSALPGDGGETTLDHRGAGVSPLPFPSFRFAAPAPAAKKRAGGSPRRLKHQAGSNPRAWASRTDGQ